MLIRSQDKERIMNFTGASVGIEQEMSNDNNICIAIFYSENAYEELGEYSTKAKAMKVLDMIQEAYCKFMSVKNDDAWVGKESVFYMPEDSEVEV